ncbi:DUF6538 domain-containing protein [Sphingopyxis sp. MWB1]|uniref:DUF6538 domain-containing protein n=1 Tax=Sphingopyxis sp. MWB1 TaxID=1537715 RepID=UPI00068EF321|nr:DUF6538 domain-containing protein [Sphingopyxis sp. MWB1]
MREYETKVGATYYFRRVVPPDLIGHFRTATGKPRIEWKYSLKTKDRREAAPKIRKWAEVTDKLIDAARRGGAVLRADPPVAAGVEAMRRSQAVIDDMELASVEAAELARAHWDDVEARAEADPAFAAQQALRAAATRLDRERQDIEFARELAREERDARKVALMDLFERYASVPGRNAKTIAQWRPYVQKLIAFTGIDDATRLTTRHLIDWRNHLRDVETYRGKRLSAKTINGSYLAAVNVVLGWAVDDGLLDSNPARDVKPVQLPKQPQTRSRSLSDDEARKVLLATRKGREGKEGDDFVNAKRWVPWLLCYTGARVTEITQLRKADVVKLGEVHAIRITPDAGSVKNKLARVVPLHPDLIAQGFLTFVAKRRAGPLFFSPDKRRSESAINRQANRLGSKLAEWVRSLGVGAPQPNHAWRHRFVTLGERYGLSERAVDAMTGHSSGKMNRRYGENEIDVVYRELGKIPAFRL